MAKKGELFSILDKGVTVEGTLSSMGKLLINGVVKGELSGEFVTISPGGEVIVEEAKVKCMTIGGAFEGKLEAGDRVVVLATGNCQGEVICRDLVVEAGGILNAKVVRLPENKQESQTKLLSPFGKKKKLLG